MMEASSKEKNFSSHYEEDGEDSDIESRLYAEIHYTNNIIGDESDTVQDVSNNDVENKRTRECGKGRKKNSAIPDLYSQSNLQTSEHVITQQTVSNNSAQNNIEAPTIPNSQDPVQTQSNLNSNSRKRQIITDSHEHESKKKKKKQSKNDNINDRNRIINPYHKDVVNNQQYGIKLLSPAFLNLFFGKSKGKKKKAANKKPNSLAQTSTVSVSYNIPTSANTPQEPIFANISQEPISANIPQEPIFANISQEPIFANIPQENLQNSSNTQVPESRTEASGSQDSEAVIDICSESSNDSRENDSKYNNIQATDKKLTEQTSAVNNEDSDDETSDSNESIFEVPVPPKPAPPVIDLNDSDNENEESSDDSDSSSSSDDSPPPNSQDVERRSVTNISENVQEHGDSECESSESVNSEPDNLILNCKEIQKGASSINDIKRMSHEISSKTSFVNETSTVTVLDKTQNDLEALDNSVAGEKIPSPVKEINSAVSKPVRKSPRIREKVSNIAREKSFFQPMTDKMKSFYNDSWGGENFDLEKLKSQMPRDPKKWAILDDDLIVSFSRRKRYFGVVCNRCQKEGHRQNQCLEPYKPPVCHMCGIKGHLETGCPEKKCLSCGKRQNSYRKTCEQCVKLVCARCKARGHLKNFCPDLWRSYHQTINNTKANLPTNVKIVMKPQHNLHCCNCAKKGHNSENCRKLRWSEHFPVPSQVISYNGPEYPRENISTGTYLNNSDSFGQNFGTSSNSSDKTAHRVSITEKFPRSPRNQALGSACNSSDKTEHRNLVPERLPASPRNQISLDRNIIFKVLHKNSNPNLKLQKVFLELSIPNKDQLGMFNYWKSLSTFLFELVKDLPSKFLLRQNNQQVVMEMYVPQKYRIKIEKLLLQYAERNNIERSYMFLNCDRTPNRVVEHLKEKFNEFNNMTLKKDILEMYEEMKSLKSSESNQQQSNKHHKLVVCQKELLTALYRESCADDSLIKLKKLYNKINSKLKCSSKPSKKKAREQKLQKLPTMTLKCLLEYLFYYNNVFAPYESNKLRNFINEYKKRLEQHERLRNNPLLFPQGNNYKAGNNNSGTQSSSFSSTVTTENMLTSSSSNHIPSLLLINTSTIATNMQPNMSEMQPMETLMQPEMSSSSSRPLLSINTSISSNFNFSQNLPTVPQTGLFISRKNDSKHDQSSRLLKRAKKLIAQARDNDKPHVRKLVEILENKIKNGVYLYQKDVQTLKVLINKSR